MNCTTLGIDVAKPLFQLHGVDERGHVVEHKRVSRKKLLEPVAQLPACLIGMEACSSSQYWAREFQQWGHTVKRISPQFVKPYVKGNKNDSRDAEAICEVVARPHMRFVPLKTVESQDSQAIHRLRSRLIKQRTALVNQALSQILDQDERDCHSLLSMQPMHRTAPLGFETLCRWLPAVLCGLHA